ncbi:uncharacterized protein LOC120103940 isoform X1 [Phoenix dactylifera]|uniref:Uncharacterized protein LOC120103940 isoform X1 n=1 Tax=Phoenix dactylifera TaxID=42345 RepID=A0A8B9A3S2_PHODC|nr:uncharacterized protein LOC120103940 isoform X1 [Phoenix dactylifera]
MIFGSVKCLKFTLLIACHKMLAIHKKRNSLFHTPEALGIIHLLRQGERKLKWSAGRPEGTNGSRPSCHCTRAILHAPSRAVFRYCVFKVYNLNEHLFSFGFRYARFLWVWFTVGAAFSLMALLGVSVVRDGFLFVAYYMYH